MSKTRKTKIPDDERAERASVRSWRVILPIGRTNYTEYVRVEESGISVGVNTIPWDEIDEARRAVTEAK